MNTKMVYPVLSVVATAAVFKLAYGDPIYALFVLGLTALFALIIFKLVLGVADTIDEINDKNIKDEDHIRQDIERKVSDDALSKINNK